MGKEQKLIYIRVPIKNSFFFCWGQRRYCIHSNI